MLKTEFSIGDRLIGGNAEPYIIAEIGSNFNQDQDVAKRLIDKAAEAGTDAVKFQLFRADVLYPGGGKMYDIFKSIQLDAAWVPELMSHAQDRNIEFFSSAFDPHSVDVLFDAGVRVFKVASSETTQLLLLRYIASKNKPLLISTGMCDVVDVEEAVAVCREAGNTSVALLQCGSMYPLPLELSNLNVINAFAQRFGCPVGFSDHTLGITAAIASVGVGAHVIEKHFTLDKNAEGPDHFYALEPKEFRNYVDSIREAYTALGSGTKELLPKERETGRRDGFYATRNLPIGKTITENDIDSRRPAIGLRVRYRSTVIGARVARPVAKDDPITWDLLSIKGKRE